MSTVYTIIATAFVELCGLVGMAVFIVGGLWLVISIVSWLGRLMGQAWIKCSRKWRDILKAEETILQFRRDREAYLAWKEKTDND